jgi:hypothetical protein
MFVSGRKLELDHLLSEKGIDFCLLNERHLLLVQVPRFTDCLSKDRPPDSRSRRSDACPLRHRSLCSATLGSEAPAGYCHTPSVGDQNSETRSGQSPAIRTLDRVRSDRVHEQRISPTVAGGLNAKQMDWNFRLTTARGSVLRDYVSRNSCCIYDLAAHTKNTIHGDFHCQGFRRSVHLTACPALSWDHPPVLIDTTCLSSFQKLLACPYLTRLNWERIQACLEDRLR